MAKNRYAKYGINNELYAIMAEQQVFKCAVCNDKETTKNNKGAVKRLSVDHCHTTGRIRGLLCHNCNVALGLLNENTNTIKNLYKYIVKYSNDL